jgi:hypothetical protein
MPPNPSTVFLNQTKTVIKTSNPISK